MLREKAAEDRAGDARCRPDRRDIDDVTRAFARRNDVGDHVCASATSPPPPSPCTARPTMMTSMLGASAQMNRTNEKNAQR